MRLILLAFAFLADPEIERGKDVFRACSGCHNVLTDARKSAPSLRTLFGKVRMRNGKRTSEDNVAQLILDGYNGMPSYRNMFRPADWSDLMAYLKTLRARPEIGAMLQPIRGSDEQVLATGKKLYEDRCRSCHENEGAKAPGILGVYKRDTLANGEPVREAAIMARVRDNHAGAAAPDSALDDNSQFALIAWLKAQ